MNQGMPYNYWANNWMTPGMQPMPSIPLQPRQVDQVNGKESLKKLQMAPNSSMLVMDTTAPLVWLCVSDSVGSVTYTAYDITLHKEAPPVDVNSLENRVAALEAAIAKIGGKQDA